MMPTPSWKRVLEFRVGILLWLAMKALSFVIYFPLKQNKHLKVFQSLTDFLTINAHSNCLLNLINSHENGHVIRSIVDSY